MPLARGIKVIVIFNGVDISEDIAHSISSLNYTDNSKNAIDDLELELENMDYRWLKEWYPDENAQLIVGIYEDNGKDGSFLDIGTFYIDEPTFDNDRLNLKCIAIPSDGNIRDQKNTKAWEKITLKELVNQIAVLHQMNVEIHADNEYYKRLDQENETDLAFIDRVIIRDSRIRSFSLKKKNKGIYDKVEVSYYDPDKKKLIREVMTKEELEKRNEVKTDA